jgi:hypothetical protein
MNNGLFRALALASSLLVLVSASGHATAQESAASLLEPSGGLLWSRSDTSGGLSHDMAAEETFVSSERELYVLSDKIGLSPENQLSAFFASFQVSYRESLLRDAIEDAEFRIDALPSAASISLQNYFDVTFPWGTERFSAEYPLAGGGQAPTTIVLRYNLFKLRYSLSGLDRLAATTSIEALDRQRVTLRLYSNKGTFSFDMPIAWFIELYGRLKTR